VRYAQFIDYARQPRFATRQPPPSCASTVANTRKPTGASQSASPEVANALGSPPEVEATSLLAKQPRGGLQVKSRLVGAISMSCRDRQHHQNVNSNRRPAENSQGSSGPTSHRRGSAQFRAGQRAASRAAPVFVTEGSSVGRDSLYSHWLPSWRALRRGARLLRRRAACTARRAVRPRLRDGHAAEPDPLLYAVGRRRAGRSAPRCEHSLSSSAKGTYYTTRNRA